MSHHPIKLAIIRNQLSGLVLEGDSNPVTLQLHTGYPAQLWELQNAGADKFFIINRANGEVLDLQGGEGSDIITTYKHGGSTQQWFINSDATIVNVGSDLAVDIFEENHSAGNRLIGWTKTGKSNQQFQIKYLTK